MGKSLRTSRKQSSPSKIISSQIDGHQSSVGIVPLPPRGGLAAARQRCAAAHRAIAFPDVVKGDDGVVGVDDVLEVNVCMDQWWKKKVRFWSGKIIASPIINQATAWLVTIRLLSLS